MVEYPDYDSVYDELKEAIGENFVSAGPAVLNGYSRDFTTVPSGRPNIAAMPGSTEDVQALQRIAYKHKVPVVVMSTGFNHGGLALCQRGGLMVDLRRMRKMEIDEESMTATIGPAVQARTLYKECLKITTAGGLKLKPSLALSFGSVSVLSNYVSAGGGGWAGKYGGNCTLIVNMTWVLPDGEILKTGPGGVPGVGSVAVPSSPGPNISGMFINASGTMGICTEMTIKLFVEKEEHERIYLAILFGEDDDRACEVMVDLYYSIARSNLQDATYKTHAGLLAQSSAYLSGDDPLDMVEMMPTQPLVIFVQGLTEEEVEIKSKLIKEMCEVRGMQIADPYQLGFGALVVRDNFKGSFGIEGNNQCAYKGCFQFCAFMCKMEEIPRIWKEWKVISRRYWAMKHERPGEEVMMSGFNTQGPLPFGRLGVFEVDWWWNHGDPEDIKKAAQIVRKFNEFGLKNKGALFRNNFGAGETALPHWGIYYEILKKIKDVMDPDNIMNPDVLPIGSDYLRVL